MDGDFLITLGLHEAVRKINSGDVLGLPHCKLATKTVVTASDAEIQHTKFAYNNVLRELVSNSIQKMGLCRCAMLKDLMSENYPVHFR